MNFLSGAVHGEYPLRSELAAADCVLGFSFGTSLCLDSVNSHLALKAATYANEERPLFIEETLQRVLPIFAPNPHWVYRGAVSNYVGSRGGSAQVLRDAQPHMQEQNLRRPLLVAQAHHVGRVALEAIKLGMEPVVVSGMPKTFDKDSLQPATRSRNRWICRELPGYVALKLTDRI